MSYRNDLDAAYARIAQLERRIKELEEEKYNSYCRECSEKIINSFKNLGKKTYEFNPRGRY